jgi:CBS domain-containing protein
MLIHHLISSKAVTCHEHDSLERAAQLMWENDVGFLPVTDEGGRLVGVVTDRDLLMAAYTSGASLAARQVHEAMAHRPISCTRHDEVIEMEHLMATHQIRRLPVVDESGQPIAVISLGDIARASLHGHEVSSRSPTWALAAITRPRRVGTT